MPFNLLDAASLIIAVLFAVSVHESAHALMANYLGDPTGKLAGRISLNPFRHLDLFGTLALILFHIGWGKPVPFNPENLRHPKRDSALIALAGPISNILSAVVVALPLKYMHSSVFAGSFITNLLDDFFFISIVLFALNVLPFPPLDGSKIIGVFVPHRWRFAYEHYLREGVKYFIIFILFDVLVLERLTQFSVLKFVIGGIVQTVLTVISLGT